METFYHGFMWGLGFWLCYGVLYCLALALSTFLAYITDKYS